MDTNMSQALKIAGGLLVAIVLISALVFFFRELAPTQIALEDIKVFEQTTDFNKEFEVYNKSIMYGLDVISAINKAASHNKTYIDAYGYSDELRDNYLVDIIFDHDEITLTQSIELYKLNNIGSNTVEVETSIDEIIDNSDENVWNEICFALKKNNVVDANKLKDELDKDGTAEDEDTFEDSITISSEGAHTINVDGEQKINLIDEGERDNYYISEFLYDYIIDVSSTELKSTVKNTKEIYANPPIEPYLNNSTIWSRAVLETYPYSFKSRKFRCIDVTYSDITGRLTSLTFQEI